MRQTASAGHVGTCSQPQPLEPATSQTPCERLFLSCEHQVITGQVAYLAWMLATKILRYYVLKATMHDHQAMALCLPCGVYRARSHLRTWPGHMAFGSAFGSGGCQGHENGFGNGSGGPGDACARVTRVHGEDGGLAGSAVAPSSLHPPRPKHASNWIQLHRICLWAMPKKHQPVSAFIARARSLC